MKNSSRVGREWVKGKYPKGFEVLEVGAGSNPAPGTTRAIDIRPIDLSLEGVKECKSLKEYKTASAEDIPYKDKFFDRGISRWAIGPRIKGIRAIRELYRVLKPGGEVYISILNKDKSSLPAVKRNLVKVGFEILDVYTGTYIRGKKKLKEYIIHAIK